MITLEQFVAFVNEVKSFEALADNLYNLGVDIVETPIYLHFGKLSDLCVELMGLTEEGIDLVNWWLYEDVPKELEINDEVIDVESTYAFYNFLLNGYFLSSKS